MGKGLGPALKPILAFTALAYLSLIPILAFVAATGEMVDPSGDGAQFHNLPVIAAFVLLPGIPVALLFLVCAWCNRTKHPAK